MTSTDHCALCRHCTVAKPGRRKAAPHPCTLTPPALHRPRTPGRPRKPIEPLSFRSLFHLLKAITPKRLWKKYRRPRGYSPETHKRVPLTLPPKPAAPFYVPSPWRELRKEHKGEEWLITTSPRIATQVHHGPSALLRPFFPDVLEAPQSNLTEDEATLLTIEQQARRLSRRDALCIGGLNRTLEQLSTLPSSIDTSDFQDTEPLRAMALQEVTNIDDLEALSKLLEEEEEE